MATKTQSKKTPPIDQSGSPVQATAKTDIKATLEQMMSHPPAQTREEFLGLPAGVELAPRAGKNLLEQDEDITADDIFGTDPVQGPGIDDQPKQLDTQPSTSGDPDAKDISTKKNSAYDKDGAFIPPRIPVTEEDVDRFLSCIARNAYYREYLGRGVDSTGLATYSAKYQSGKSLAAIEQEIKNSYEAQLRGLYLTYFLREPDRDGFQYWYNELVSGKSTLEQIRSNFRSVPECKFECL